MTIAALFWLRLPAVLSASDACLGRTGCQQPLFYWADALQPGARCRKTLLWHDYENC